MVDDLFPPGASLLQVFYTFITALAGFHLFLVILPFTRLNKRGWKYVDYVWLGFGALALVGGAGQARQIVAAKKIVDYEARAQTYYDLVRSNVRMLAKDPGPMCGQFVRSEHSPPPEVLAERQRAYDAGCEWAKALAQRLPVVAPRTPLSKETLAIPASSEDGVVAMVKGLVEETEELNKILAGKDQMVAATGKSDLENTVVLVSPMLLAVALALRMTKVTGELRLG